MKTFPEKSCEKPGCILKKRGNFVGKYFHHFMLLYGQTSLEKLFFSVLNIIDIFLFFAGT